MNGRRPERRIFKQGRPPPRIYGCLYLTKWSRNTLSIGNDEGAVAMMFMNALKQLFHSDETETNDPTDSSSSEPQNDPWRNLQPWGGTEGMPPIMTPNANTSPKSQEGDGPSDRSKQTAQRTQRRSLFGRRNSATSARPNPRAQGFNHGPGAHRQPGGSLTPQIQPQHGMRQHPQFSQPQRRTPNPGVQYPTPYVQPWFGGFAGGVGQHGMRRQVQMYDEWGVPVQGRTAVPQGTFWVPPQRQMMGHPMQQRLPVGSTMYPGVPRRPIRQPQEPWF